MAYSTIPKGSLQMNTKLYTGTGSAMNITGVGFQPDMTWIKPRSVVDNHILYDSVRGVSSRLIPNLNSAAGTVSDMVTSFNSDGVSLGTNGNVTANGVTFASWNWKANGADSANTNGSINSTVSANTTSGFSIVKWTGSGANATVGHGLGVTPAMLIVKNATGTGNWRIWNQNLSSAQTLELNATSGALTSAGQFNSSATFNSTVFSVGGEGDTNESSSTIVAYCFSEIKGYSKFGSYTGNGNADGTFVYTGFSPSFVMIKRTDTTSVWGMYDNKRIGYNTSQGVQNVLRANSSDATATGGGDAGGYGGIDFLSNGFKCRLSDGNMNATSGTYIYMAFAENPFVATSGTTALPVTAR